jgi:HSP20 family protein
MHVSTIEVMHDQVRAIYRAATGTELTESKATSGDHAAVDPDEVARRFTELEVMARSVPTVVERIPPFSFEPLADVVDGEDELLVEVAVPGVSREDLAVRCEGARLLVSGVRRGSVLVRGRTYLHAEIPCGPFERTIALPSEPHGAAIRVDVENGMLTVHVPKNQPDRRRPSPGTDSEKKATKRKEPGHGSDK